MPTEAPDVTRPRPPKIDKGLPTARPGTIGHGTVPRKPLLILGGVFIASVEIPEIGGTQQNKEHRNPSRTPPPATKTPDGERGLEERKTPLAPGTR